MPARPCPTCGNPLPDGARFCGQCGLRMSDPAMKAVQPLAAPMGVPRPARPADKPEKPSLKTMVEFAAPASVTVARPAPAAPAAPVFSDDMTVKRDRKELMALMEAAEAAAEAPAATRRAEYTEDPTVARAAPDLSKTIADPMAQTLADPVSIAAIMSQVDKSLAEKEQSRSLDKTQADPLPMQRARDMVLEAIKHDRAEPRESVESRHLAPRPASDLNQTRSDAFLQAQARADAFDPPSQMPSTSGQTGQAGPRSQQSPLSHSISTAPAPAPQPSQAPVILQPPPQPAPQPQPAQQPQHVPLATSGKKTMIGVAAADLGVALPPPSQQLQRPAQQNAYQPPPEQPPQQVPPQQQPQGLAGHGMKTMMGVAIPGIAPMNPGVQQAPFPTSNKTMMGVAMPGIAPTHSAQNPQNQRPQQQPQQQPQPRPMTAPMQQPREPQRPVMPMPAPLVEEPMPAMLHLPQKRGVPVGLAVGIALALLLVGGGVMFALYKPSSPVTAAPELDAEGHDVLHVKCASCVDGTSITVGSAPKAIIAAHEARILLGSPLRVGPNPLVLRIDRPGVGRDESAPIEVPVAYRLRADLSTLSATPPAITVRVEAAPGTDVRVNDKPLALDAKGEGAVAIDVGTDTTGASDETKRIDRVIDYSITPKGQALQKGTLHAQAGIAPMRIDSPSSHAFVATPSITVAGQTAAGADVRVNDLTTVADAHGMFSVDLPNLATGETKIHVVTQAKNLAPRSVDFSITRVASLEDAAKSFEAENPLGFDAFADGSKPGAKVAVDGEIVDARPGDHQTLLLVESKRGCAHLGQCLVRVTAFGDGAVTRGDNARAYGRYVRNVTAAGKTVPEVIADIFITKKGGT